MGYLVAFVGPSGAGKTMLIMEALARLPEHVGVVQSVVTRPSRGTYEDEVFYRFITREEHIALRDAGELLTEMTFDGNYYGTPRSSVLAWLPKKHGMMAMLESTVQDWRASVPYPIKVIKIVPKNFSIPAHLASRRSEDEARDKIDISPDLVIENDFGPGGREKAIAQVLGFLLGLS